MKSLNLLSSFPILVFSVLSFSQAAAQQAEQQIEVQEDALRQLAAEETRRRQVEGADRYRDIEGGPVTLSEVMQDPDNVRLNFRYAQTQVADGNLRGAGATLERILLINPNLTRIRLFYAYVLYRLDNIKEMQEQLNTLDGMRLSAADQEEIIDLRRRATRRLEPTRFSAMFAGGIAYQTNANFAPGSGFNDVIVPTPLGPFIGEVPVTNPKEDDVSYIGTIGLNMHHDLGHPEGHYLFGSASAYWNEQVTVDTSDYNTFSGNLGVKYYASWADITGQFLAGHLRLDGDSFLSYYGFDIDFEREFDALTANFRHRTTFEDYDNDFTFSEERTGARHEFEVGANYRWSSNVTIGGALTYTDKNANRVWREFDGLDFRFYHTWIISRGIYLRNVIDYGYEDYDAPNPRISLTTREDDNFRYQATLSSPLRRLFGGINLPRAIGDIRLNASVRYYDSSSNIQNYDYDNLRVEFLFSKRFDL